MSRTSSGLARLLGSPWAWLAVGLSVRIFHVATLGNRYYFGDTSEYEIAALRLLHSGSLEGNSVRAPAYPAVLALSFWLGGEQNYVVARVIQLAISLVHMLLGIRLATRIGGRGDESPAGHAHDGQAGRTQGDSRRGHQLRHY